MSVSCLATLNGMVHISLLCKPRALRKSVAVIITQLVEYFLMNETTFLVYFRPHM